MVPYKVNRGDSGDVLQETRTTEDDVESGGTKKDYKLHTSAVKTPFFHPDLEGAVRAAEYGPRN